MEEKYSLNEVVKYAMDLFGIEYDKESETEKNLSYTSAEVPGKIRKKFLNFVKSHTVDGKTLWDLAEDRNYEKANNKSFRFFDKETMEYIIYSDEIYDYLIKHSPQKYTPRAELQKLVEDAHEKWDRYVKENNYAEPVYVGKEPSPEEIEQKRSEIMLNALFELFFEPFNTELLANDMYNAMCLGGNTETRASAESKIRYRDDRNYYKTKPKDEILDELADKIAERLISRSSSNSKA